jgi:hypothetical protein
VSYAVLGLSFTRFARRWVALGILQFVGKRRFVNKWKDEKKNLAGVTTWCCACTQLNRTGNPVSLGWCACVCSCDLCCQGRDFRGDVSTLLRDDIDPSTLFKLGSNVGEGYVWRRRTCARVMRCMPVIAVLAR